MEDKFQKVSEGWKKGQSVEVGGRGNGGVGSRAEGRGEAEKKQCPTPKLETEERTSRVSGLPVPEAKDRVQWGSPTHNNGRGEGGSIKCSVRVS